MRPLAIWAMQWALEPPKLLTVIKSDVDTNESDDHEFDEDDGGFMKVANLLKIPEDTSRSVISVLYDIICNKFRN